MPLCFLCPSRYFMDANAIRMHRKSKHKVYPCGKCTRVLCSQQALDQHTSDKHGTFESRLCNIEFFTWSGIHLQDDVTVQMEFRNTYPCEKCNKVLCSQQALDQHTSDKHSATESRHCDCGFPACPGIHSQDDKGERMRQESKPAYPCGECNKVLSSQQGLDQHTLDKHYKFKCAYCKDRFSTNDDRLSHEEAIHLIAYMLVDCRYCDREFNSEEDRRQHEDAKHRFECRYCGREFATGKGRDTHEEAKHPTFECQHCDREFYSKDSLHRHEDAVHRKNVACFRCDRFFTSADALSKHNEAKHYFEPTPDIQCDTCSLKFSTRHARNRHKRTCGLNLANRVQWPKVHPRKVLTTLQRLHGATKL